MSCCPCRCKLGAELAQPTVSLHVNKLWTSSRGPASLPGCSRHLILISGSVVTPGEVSYSVTREVRLCLASEEPQIRKKMQDSPRLWLINGWLIWLIHV